MHHTTEYAPDKTRKWSSDIPKFSKDPVCEEKHLKENKQIASKNFTLNKYLDTFHSSLASQFSESKI